MGCCGQRQTPTIIRPAGNKAAPRTVAVQESHPPAAASVAATDVPLRFVRQGDIRVRGPITGRQYAFSQAAPVAQVDMRDTASLLRTTWFKLA
jgi:hypothetical protein